MSRYFILLLLLVSACGSQEQATSPEAESDLSSASAQTGDGDNRLWVTSQYLERHSCPSKKCGIVGRAFFREAMTPLEERGGWVRTTKYYDAACVDGRSKYVDKGDDACSLKNGIEKGRFAEWVQKSSLSKNRPADPAETAAADEKMVAQSDDFTQHRKAFVKAARYLIDQGRCTAAEIEEMGGWVKSSNHRDEPVYFTYCGGMTISNRIYLNANTGETFQE